MITIITKGKIIYTTVIGKVTEEDFKELRNALDTLMSEYRKIRWLYEMVEFEGWEIKTFFKDTAYSLKHTNDFEKIAMVGEKKWQELMTDIMKPFTSADIKYYEIGEKKQAEKWIAE